NAYQRFCKRIDAPLAHFCTDREFAQLGGEVGALVARQEEIDAPTVLHVATTDAACDNGAKSRVAQHPKYYLVLWSHHLLNQDALKAAFAVRPKGRSQLVVRRVNAGLVADVQAHTSCLPAVRHHR